MRRLLWILVAILTSVLGILVAHQDGVDDWLARIDVSSLPMKIVLAVILGAVVLALFRQHISHAIESALIWMAIAALLAVGYTYRFELREVGERVMSEFVPGYAARRGRVVEVARGNGGNFRVVAHVNGARIAMVLDTGATSVVLTQEAAKAAGLPIEVLAYTVNVDTANGRARAAPVTLDSLAIGGIVERAVPALIAQPGQLRTSLLGMSFLDRLDGWEVRGDRLMMRGYP